MRSIRGVPANLSVPNSKSTLPNTPAVPKRPIVPKELDVPERSKVPNFTINDGNTIRCSLRDDECIELVTHTIKQDGLTEFNVANRKCDFDNSLSPCKYPNLEANSSYSENVYDGILPVSTPSCTSNIDGFNNMPLPKDKMSHHNLPDTQKR